jgi:hypothetical protein
VICTKVRYCREIYTKLCSSYRNFILESYFQAISCIILTKKIYNMLRRNEPLVEEGITCTSILESSIGWRWLKGSWKKKNLISQPCSSVRIEFAKGINCFIEDHIMRDVDSPFSNIQTLEPFV